MKGDFRTILRYEDTFNGLGVYLMVRDSYGVYCARPVDLVFEQCKDYPLLPKPTILFKEDSDGRKFLKDIANELARLGFLPELAKKNEAELAAVRGRGLE